MKKLREIINTKPNCGPDLDEEKTPEDGSWSLFAELYGVEVNGGTHYYSKPLEKHQFGLVYDYKCRTIEIKLKPNYYSKGGEPDFYMFIRPTKNSGRSLFLDKEGDTVYVGR